MAQEDEEQISTLSVDPVAFIREVEPVSVDTPLTELMTQVAHSPCPVPVVDAHGRYKGTISRATLLHTLDRTDKGAA